MPDTKTPEADVPEVKTPEVDKGKYGLDSPPWVVTPVVQNDGFTVEYHANNTETNDYFRSTDLKYVQQTIGSKVH